MEIEEISSSAALPLLSLNHISLLCRSVQTSARFYEEVLGFGFVPINCKRPSSSNSNGAWLFNYGVGIHLLENNSVVLSSPINPKDNHISFQNLKVGWNMQSETEIEMLSLRSQSVSFSSILLDEALVLHRSLLHVHSECIDRVLVESDNSAPISFLQQSSNPPPPTN